MRLSSVHQRSVDHAWPGLTACGHQKAECLGVRTAHNCWAGLRAAYCPVIAQQQVSSISGVALQNLFPIAYYGLRTAGKIGSWKASGVPRVLHIPARTGAEQGARCCFQCPTTAALAANCCMAENGAWRTSGHQQYMRCAVHAVASSRVCGGRAQDGQSPRLHPTPPQLDTWLNLDCVCSTWSTPTTSLSSITSPLTRTRP